MNQNYTKITVSIIVPVYNVESYIEACLKSALNQTFNSFEIICVNDGSTDNSWKIVREIAKKNDRIKLINNYDNNGLSFARNCGMKIAQGKYITFLDSDDTIDCKAIAELYAMANESQCDIILYDMEYRFESYELRQRFPDIIHMNPLYNGELMSGGELYCQFGEKGDPPMTAATMFLKRSFLVDNNIVFNELIIHEDLLFVFQCMTLAKRVRCTTNRYYQYLRRDCSITTSEITMNNILSFFYIYCEEVNWILTHKIQNKCLREITDRIAKQYSAAKYMAITYKDCISLEKIEKDTRYPAEFKMKFLIFMRQIAGGYMRNLSLNDINNILKYRYVIIYGAGKVTWNSIQYLSGYGINEFIIAVTNANKNSYIMGNKIYSIDELNYDKEKCIVLLSVAKNNQTDIIKHLNELGYKTIVSLV